VSRPARLGKQLVKLIGFAFLELRANVHEQSGICGGHTVLHQSFVPRDPVFVLPKDAVPGR